MVEPSDKVRIWINQIHEIMKEMEILLIKKKNNPYNEIFLKFEKVYLNMSEEYIQNQLNENDFQIVYGSLLKSLKRLKRDIENDLKFDKTDVEFCLEKIKLEHRIIVPPLKNELKLGKIPKLIEFVLEEILVHNLNILDYTNHELSNFAVRVIKSLKVEEDLGINIDILKNLIETICKNYNVVPFHNFSHAFSVFQMLAHCYYNSDLSQFMTKLDIFAGFIACLAHDMNHKGVNNLYKVKKKSIKSLLYSETSVLENMHSSKFFNLINDPKLDILESIKDPILKSNFKKIIISSILATDMARHIKLLDKFTKRSNLTIKMKNETLDKNDLLNDFILTEKKFDDRKSVLRSLIHACDICNPCYNFESYMNWCHLLSQEFHEQTIKEAKNNLEVTEFLKYKDMKTFYNGQIFFSKNFVLPLWKQISIFFPNLKHLPETVEENLRILEEKKNNN